MAEKKKSSRAAKVASSAEKKASAETKKNSGAAKKAASVRNTPAVKTEYEKTVIPVNVIVALSSLAIAVLFIAIAVNPDGALLQLVQGMVLGLIGQVGFYFAIPGLLYLFVICLFRRKTAVKFRGFCIIAFVFLCGSIYHLIKDPYLGSGADVILNLYTGGAEGITGGILCGGFAELLLWAFSRLLSFILCILAAVIALLGAMQITIPSIIRAIANRPREELDDEAEYVEPAAKVVNHIANKNIEKKRQRREKAVAGLPQSTDKRQEPAAGKAKKAEPAIPVAVEAEEESISSAPSRAKGIMNTLDAMEEAPGKKSRKAEKAVEAAPVQKSSVSVDVEEDFTADIPKTMPKLNLREEIPSIVKQNKMPESLQEKSSEEKGGKVTAKEATASAKQVTKEIEQNQAAPQPAYCFPPIDLLKRPGRGSADGTEEMRENSRRLNETLASFNIDAHIINVTRGPSVTRYEVELDKGVRLNKLTGCADDIALSLGASGVRIAAVPGKISVVGIEVPNRAVTTVSLREVIDSGEFNKAKSKSSIALGKSIEGSAVVGNIAKMPHLLIAGTTGSGKSVCMNSIIISLLYKAGPEDVKLIMVDPKMVELGIYNGIPHLLIPVVTDPKKAAGSLQWAVTEMLRRYKMMSDLGVRDLESYNSIVMNEEGGKKLPQVVIIIDELADLMMVAAKEVEDSICRIAQMGRAAGMHLIIATQRPSANVITGLMKANIPSRIAFSVASAMESRIILDTMGAEKLVGKGDMLYAPIGSGKPLRVQGCFVTDSEVESVAGYVKENYNAEYNQQVLEEIEKTAQQTGKKTASVSEIDANEEELDGDEMLPQAVDVILETGQASVSMLQRRLKLGYARAARIVDEMEEKGIVGPFQGSKPRAILITKEQWQSMQSGGSQQMAFEDLDEDPDAVPEDIY